MFHYQNYFTQKVVAVQFSVKMFWYARNIYIYIYMYMYTTEYVMEEDLVQTIDIP